MLNDKFEPWLVNDFQLKPYRKIMTTNLFLHQKESMGSEIDECVQGNVIAITLMTNSIANFNCLRVLSMTIG